MGDAADEDHGTDSADVPEGDYGLAAPDPEELRSNSFLPDRMPEPGIAAPEERPFQFSLAELMLLITLAAVVLGLLRLVSAEWSAGLTGLGVLIYLVALAFWGPRWPILYVAWWAMFVVYLLACLAAIVKGRAP